MVKPTSKDKAKYLHIANGSCAEMRTQIFIGMKVNYIANDVGERWVKETKMISAMITGLIKKLN